MKKLALIIAVMFAGSVLASPAYDESPTQNFSTSSNRYTTVTITWKTAANPQAVCNKEAKSRGYHNFGFTLQACAFWEGNTCTIVTGKDTTMHSLGHEVRHCFQGDWHSENGQK
jgi:hypothetical protein